ncbi:hypothetical protein ACEPAH_2120 [Sanghuangporus vaninii]
MTDAGVVVDGAGLALRVIQTHGARGIGLVSRANFAIDSIKNMFVYSFPVRCRKFPLVHQKAGTDPPIRILPVDPPMAIFFRFFIKYYVLASITLLYFDHIITLPLEVRRIWCARFTGATFLFLLNRYIPFLGYIPVVFGMFNPPWTITYTRTMDVNLRPRRCKKFAPFVGILSLISNIISAIILILRTYALYERALWVLVVTGIFGAASVAVGAWSVNSVDGELFNFQPIVVCVPMLIQGPPGLKFAWITTFCFDFVVFGLTIARTYRYMKAQSRLHMESRLTVLLMRDGSIYFLVMSIVNAANYILATRIQNSFFASATGTNSILANVISVTMISRLLLNLREEAAEYNRRTSSGDGVPTVRTLTDTNLVFTSRIFGNLTAEFDYEEDTRRFRTRGGSENYYSYDFSGEDSDEVYELQSRSTRTGYSARTLSTDPGSSTGTGTIAGSSSASASGSGSGSGSGSSSDKGVVGRKGYSKLGRAASVNTTLTSAMERHPRGEPQTPVVTVGENRQLWPLEVRSPHLLSPLSPGTMSPLSPTLRTSRHSPHPPPTASLSDHRKIEEHEGFTREDFGADRDSSNLRRQAQSPVLGKEETIKLSNLERRPRDESGREYHLFPNHYRRPPHSTPES